VSEVLAAIDVGTNSVLLTVARRHEQTLEPLVERAEITRLGRGVDRSGELTDEGVVSTLRVLGAYAEEALSLGVSDPSQIACVATSAARDAANGGTFLERVRSETGLVPQIIGGQREAELMFLAARHDFCSASDRSLAVDFRRRCRLGRCGCTSGAVRTVARSRRPWIERSQPCPLRKRWRR
jgi:exopolyphosphatase/guanosine-5'-triphosphate,3'-diphosphate pyrophosphatase